jgi:hypothetical protein
MVVSLRTLRHSLKAPQLTPLQTSSILPFFALFLDFLHAWRWADVGQSVGGVDGSPWAAHLDCFDTWNRLSSEGFFFFFQMGYSRNSLRPLGRSLTYTMTSSWMVDGG